MGVINQYNPSKCSVVRSDSTSVEDNLRLCGALARYLRRLPSAPIWPTEFIIHLDYIRSNEVVISVEHNPDRYPYEKQPTHTFAVIGPQWARQAAAVIVKIAPSIRWDTP